MKLYHNSTSSMLLVDNQTSDNFSTSLLDEISKYLSSRDIELILCDDNFIRNINLEHRGKDSTTDVLSFPIDGDRINEPIGTIIISTDTAQKQAMEWGHTVSDELALLFIHGVLHLQGYDHEQDDGEMRREEMATIEYFKLPSSLIIRTEGV